jgi:hypothetical protein
MSRIRCMHSANCASVSWSCFDNFSTSSERRYTKFLRPIKSSSLCCLCFNFLFPGLPLLESIFHGPQLVRFYARPVGHRLLDIGKKSEKLSTTRQKQIWTVQGTNRGTPSNALILALDHQSALLGCQSPNLTFELELQLLNYSSALLVKSRLLLRGSCHNVSS